MHIAFFGTQLTDDALSVLINWIEIVQTQHQLSLYEPLYKALQKRKKKVKCWIFTKGTDVQADVLISFGGDGTILEALPYILYYQTPILGINMGRLGFLASLNSYPIIKIIRALAEKDYVLQERSMLNVYADSPKSIAALNEVTIQKRDSSSMIAIKVFADGILLNTYWADGIIVATPTGSTAYSLSCGGPIIAPGTKVMCITPVAPHSLTVRPIILDINTQLDVEVEGRIQQYMLSIDSNTFLLEPSQKIKIVQAEKTAPFILLKGEHFFNTLRNKLHWGLDQRSEII